MPSTLIFDNPVTYSIFAGIEPKDVLTFILSYISIFVAFLAFNLQRESSEKTARMEMAKVLTEAFSHSEMFEAIEYFKKVSPHLVDENGKDNKSYIELIQNAPETQRYRYRILTTLHHAERLYQKEKEAEKVLFTSLITPDIVEVALCLYKLDDYMKDVDKPVYEMVYRVFEDIRTSYLAPLLKASSEGTQIKFQKVEHTHRILSRLQDWDRQWGDEADCILTKQHILLLDILIDELSKSDILKRANDLIQNFENHKPKIKSDEKRKKFYFLYFIRANERHRLNDTNGALKDYKEAIRVNPQYDRAYLNSGLMKELINDTKGALKDYKEAIKLNPNLETAYKNRGLLRNKLKRFKEAIEDWDKLIELNPQYAPAYNNRGVANTALKKYIDAIKDYDYFITLDPENAIGYSNRGEVKFKLNDFKGAIIDCNQAVVIDSDNDEAHNFRGLAYQEMAKLARANGNEAEAEELEAKAQADFAEVERLKGLKQ